MSRRLSALSLTLLLGLTLAGCGEDSDSPSSSGGGSIEGVSVEGDPGKAPEVKWDGKLEAGKLTSEVLEEGDGEEVESGDQVLTHVWLGNGSTQQEAYSSYEAQPQALTVDPEQLPPIFIEGLEGRTIGSRVVVAGSAGKSFGEFGNPQIGIGNKDSVLMVVDLVEMYVPPKPKDVDSSELPGIVERKGEPVGFDFSGVPEPKQDGELLRTVLKEGKGKPLTTDMTVTADYLGMVHGAKKPFDESFSKKPVPFPLTGVIEGWTYGLEGVKVGSRVLLQIPPDLGYGAQEQANIPADSTLYFVVDVVSAK